MHLPTLLHRRATDQPFSWAFAGPPRLCFAQWWADSTALAAFLQPRQLPSLSLRGPPSPQRASGQLAAAILQLPTRTTIAPQAQIAPDQLLLPEPFSWPNALAQGRALLPPDGFCPALPPSTQPKGPTLALVEALGLGPDDRLALLYDPGPAWAWLPLISGACLQHGLGPTTPASVVHAPLACWQQWATSPLKLLDGLLGKMPGPAPRRRLRAAHGLQDCRLAVSDGPWPPEVVTWAERLALPLHPQPLGLVDGSA